MNHAYQIKMNLGMLSSNPSVKCPKLKLMPLFWLVVLFDRIISISNCLNRSEIIIIILNPTKIYLRKHRNEKKKKILWVLSFGEVTKYHCKRIFFF